MGRLKVVLPVILGILFVSVIASQEAFAFVTSGSANAGSAVDNGGIFVKLTPSIGDVGDDNHQTNDLYAFEEGQNLLISNPLDVDILASTGLSGTVPEGTYASHYVFFDPDPTETMEGCVTFDSDIVAIITSKNNLDASDIFQDTVTTGANYLSPSLRGLESGDIAFIGTSDEVCIDFRAGSPGDYIRVLTNFSPLGEDSDNDGILDGNDNCPDHPNFTQFDLDEDGLGNACDADVDGDGHPNPSDNCPFVANIAQHDQDHDHLGNACDADVEDDGVPNTLDNCPGFVNPDQLDTDGDGKGDACDFPESSITIYDLFNHPDGQAVPPLYGLRLDGLEDGDGSEIYTCDFDDDLSQVILTLDEILGTIVISGDVVCGHDSGNAYDAVGLFALDFLFEGVLPNGAGLVVPYSENNQGTLVKLDDLSERELLPLDVDVVPLFQSTMASPITQEIKPFHLNFGHRGVDDHLSGWGWLDYESGYGYDTDFLFVALPTPDADGDTIPNDDDNCPTIPNTTQLDLDDDGIGNACDLDVDGDNIDNQWDNCPFVSNPNHFDLDGDGLGNACDADVDNDQVNNQIDNCPLVPNPGQEDDNDNGIGNACEVSN